MDSGPAGPSNPGPTQGFKPMQSSEPNQTNPNDKLRVKFSDHELDHERESCSSSTTTSDASDDDDDDDDFFHIDPTEFGRPVPFNPTEPIRSPQTPTTQGEKPPVHPAGRYDVPDPNRIPLEIFNRTKSVSPMEWSVASNESLFSIHTGNASFSRESAFIAGRSGELSPMDGGTMPPLSPVPLMPPLYPVTPTTTTMPAPQLLRKPMNMEVGEGLEEPDDVAEAANAEAMNDVLRAAAIEHESETEKPALDWMHNSANMSRRSDGSVASFQSFAFPILTGSETRTSSIKAEPEHQRMQHHQQQQQQQQQQSPKAATQAAPAPAPPDPVTPGGTTTTTGSKGWCSCFSSCGSCCS